MTTWSVFQNKVTISFFISVFIKSRENKGLITKECTIIDAHLIYVFKKALHFSTLVINIITKFFKLELLPEHYKSIFF